MTPKPKIAAKHLDTCENTNCKFAREGVKETRVCCFGLRHEGCIYLNEDMQRRLGMLGEVETALTIGMYERNPYDAENRDKVDFPSLDNIVEPVLENAGRMFGKVYNFVYEGHEYTYRDNSMDYGSCPHCGMAGSNGHLGYYGSGQSRISCFICTMCHEKFYYHAPEV